MELLTDWDIIFERFNYNTNAIANAVRDIIGLPRPSYNVGLIRLDLDNYRFNSYSKAIPSLFTLTPYEIGNYQNEYPSLVSETDLKLTVNKVLQAIRQDDSLTAQDISALISIEEPLEEIVTMIFKRAGGNTSWLKHIRG